MTRELIEIDKEGFKDDILVIDDFIPNTYCKLFIDAFEKHKKIISFLKGKNNSDVEEVSYKKVCVSDVPDEQFINFISGLMNDAYQIYRDVRYSRCNDENVLLGMPEELFDIDLPIIKKYDPTGNDHFGPHCDTYMSGWDGDALKVNRNYRFLNILFYLNDVEEGGETEFYFTDKIIKVKPKAGRVVVFPPFWTHIHAGLRPVSGTKYIMNGYLLHKIADKEYVEMILKSGDDDNIATLEDGKLIFPYSKATEEHF